MTRWSRGFGIITLAAVLAACAPSPSQREAGGQSSSGMEQRSDQRKAITIALRNDINALTGDADQGGRNSPPSLYVQEFVNAYLTVRDQDDEPRPQLARELPSLEAGTWKLLENSRMEVTWKLRSDVKWHDGTTLTAEDVQFGWEVASDPASVIGKGTTGAAEAIERVEVQDGTTIIMHWTRPSPYGGELGLRELAILPRHLLRNAFLENKATFHQNPYFISADSFVGTGAYRPVEWERDSHLTVQAYDGYFLGRPKIDRVTFRFIQDSRTALANVLSGVIDISYLAVEFTEAATVRDEWGRSGEGTVWFQPNQLRFIHPQMRPEYARPVDLATNREVRRALGYGMDRPAIAEAANPGAVMVVDSDGVPGTRLGDLIRARAVRYEYSPTRALAMLEEAGWRRAGDGILEKGGQRFQLEFQADRGSEQEGVFSVLRENYRQIGIEVSFAELVGRDLQQRAVFPGVRHRGAFTNEPRTVQSFHTTHIASAENRWSGGNYSGYSNPALDRAIDGMERSVRTDERMTQLAEVWRILTDDAGAIALYIRPVPYLVKKGIKGPIPSSLSGSLTSNVQSWESL
jgi:peptide/nickel transport system substrate-binding protein